MTLPEWPDSSPEAVLAAQNELMYLRGFIPKPTGITAPASGPERKRRITALALWLAVRGY